MLYFVYTFYLFVLWFVHGVVPRIYTRGSVAKSASKRQSFGAMKTMTHYSDYSDPIFGSLNGSYSIFGVLMKG